MVQFKNITLPRKQHNDFWKITRDDPRSKRFNSKLDAESILNDRQYEFRSGTTIARLYELVARAERGLMSHEPIKVADLKTIIRQRGLGSQICDYMKKADLVELLEHADDEATFFRFLELPAELRNNIYTFHFESFGTVHSPAQPPITTVSRLVRQESLSLFYETCNFDIRISKFIGNRLDESYRESATLEKLSVDSYMRIPEEHLGMIRHVLIRASVHEWRGNGAETKAKCIIDLGNKSDVAEVKDFIFTREVSYPHFVPTGMEAAIRARVARMNSRIEGKNLRLSDLVRFVQAVDVGE